MNRASRGESFPPISCLRLITLTVVVAVALAALSIACFAGTVWTPNGVLVCSGLREQKAVAMTSDNAGGAIVTWQDNRSWHWDIYAQRIDSNGSQIWTGSGVPISTATGEQIVPRIIADGSGGAIIAWWDNRAGAGTWDIYAQHVKSDGNVDWGGNGVPVCTAVDAQTASELISDGLGGAIVAWNDNRTGSTDIYSQHILANGTVDPAWTPDGNVICGAPGYQSYPVLVSDDSHGAIIAWRDRRNPATNGWDVYAQRVDVNGNVGPAISVPLNNWIANGNPVCTAEGDQWSGTLDRDGTGGAVLSWYGAPDDNIYSQKIDALGNVLWQVNGVTVCNSPNEQAEPQIVSDGAGGGVIAWMDARSGDGYDIYAQHVLADGAMDTSWTNNGVPVSIVPGNQRYPKITTDGSGGGIITWYDDRSGTDDDIYAQRVAIDGIAKLTTNGLPVCTAFNGQEYPRITSNQAGGAIISWQDSRTTSGDPDIYAQMIDFAPRPIVFSVSPKSHANRGSVTIDNIAGSDFQAGATVKLQKPGQSDIIATHVNLADSSKISCVFDFEGAAVGTWNLTVTNPDGQSDTLSEAFTVSSLSSTWYLPEGTTDWGFDTYVTIQNPNEAAFNAKVTYMLKSGSTLVQIVPLPRNSQTTVNPRETVGNQDFSTKVEAADNSKAIAVDRTMAWTGGTGVGGKTKAGIGTGQEAHSTIGVTSPAYKWYLPEGSTNWGFETWLCIQNPGSEKAVCTVTYMTEDIQGGVAKTKEVGAHSRETFNMAEDIGNKDASIQISSTKPVIAERSMYRNSRREGHNSIATTDSSLEYYLAEGTTAWGFTTYVVVQNPSRDACYVEITYMTNDGPNPHPERIEMLPGTRKTIRVNDFLPNSDFSTKVYATKPIVAERSMYWDNGTGEACHDSIGMKEPAMTFFLPDGQTSDGRETFICVQNPNKNSVNITITYFLAGGGAPVLRTESIPGKTRKTLDMAQHSGINGRASVMVVSNDVGKPIMVERAMYWNSRGAGTNTIGGCGD